MTSENPWSLEFWNLTRQGEYIKKYGMSVAERTARQAGSSIGGGMPKRKASVEQNLTIIQNKTATPAPSSSIVTPTGGSVPRSLADVLADDTGHSKSYGIIGNGVTDDTVALNARLSALGAFGGGTVRLSGTYVISAQLVIPTNVTLDGGNSTTILCSAFRAFVLSGVSRARVVGIAFNLTPCVAVSGFAGLLQDATQCDVIGCTFLNIKGEIDVKGSSTGNTLAGNTITNSLSRGIALEGTGVTGNIVSRNVFTNCTGFAISGSNGMHHNLIEGNKTLQNGIELIGLQYDCHDNRIIGNHAEGTGDNGISVTGFSNLVVGNICRYCFYSGIGVYGSNNTITGNTCIGNGQSHLGDVTKLYPGILVQGAFGGVGKYNTVVGNTLDDDQAVLTQNWGVQISGANNTYTTWSAILGVPAASYVKNGINIYLTVAGGTTGSTAPTHTSGTVSDGGVLWLWINSWADGFREPTGCSVGLNASQRSITGLSLSDTTANNFNSVLDKASSRAFDSVAGNSQRYDVTGIVRHMKPWTNGGAAAYGSMFFSSLGHVYRVTNVGGTMANEPTHTTGSVTGADGIAWLLLQLNVREYLTAQTTNLGVNIDAVLGVGRIDAVATFAKILAGSGSPENVVVANPGSLFLRSDGGAGTTLYVKESGVAATGWIAK